MVWTWARTGVASISPAQMLKKVLQNITATRKDVAILPQLDAERQGTTYGVVTLVGGS